MSSHIPFQTTESLPSVATTLTDIPLGMGKDLLSEIITKIAIGAVNLFTNLLVDLIAIFVFFPNPRYLVGLDQLWFSSLAAFVVIWIIAALSYLGTLQLFPYNENITPWRFIERSLVAVIAVIISRPALALSVELVETVGRYIYPTSFAFALTNNGLQGPLSTIAGSGMLYVVAIAILYSITVMFLLLFLGILSVRALLIYTVYATFPIWMGLWIVDAGPLKYGHMVSQVVFRGFALLLAVGIFISAILATGGAIAAYDQSGGNSASELTGTQTHIDKQHLNTLSEPDPGATATGEAKSTFVLRIIAIFGSIWGAVGITSSVLGMLISVGGAAASRASGRMQRGMPGGGANTVTDRGSPAGQGGGGGGLGPGGGPPGAATPGSHGNGPAEAGWVSEGDIPYQGGRSLSNQAGMAFGKMKNTGVDDITQASSNFFSGAKDSLTNASVGDALRKGGQGIAASAKAIDTTAELLANGSNKSIMHGMEDIAEHARENPIVGDRPDSAEMLEEQNAEFIEEGEFDGNLQGINWNQHNAHFHPNAADGWEQANPDQQKVFENLDGEMYRGYKTGPNGEHLMVADADIAEAEAVGMQNAAYKKLRQDSDLSKQPPFARFDSEAGVIVANEKQGRAISEIDAHPQLDKAEVVNSQEYVDQVTASMMVGDRQGARGDVLVDSDGNAFSPNVDGMADGPDEAISPDEMDELAEQAAVDGVASKERIKQRVAEVSEQVQASHEGERLDPSEDMAHGAERMTSKNIHDEKLENTDPETLSNRKEGLRQNLDNAREWSSKSRSRTK